MGKRKRKIEERKQVVWGRIQDALAKAFPAGLSKTEVLRDVLHNQPRCNVTALLAEKAQEGLITIDKEERQIVVRRKVEVIHLVAPPAA